MVLVPLNAPLYSARGTSGTLARSRHRRSILRGNHRIMVVGAVPRPGPGSDLSTTVAAALIEAFRSLFQVGHLLSIKRAPQGSETILDAFRMRFSGSVGAFFVRSAKIHVEWLRLPSMQIVPWMLPRLSGVADNAKS